MKSKLTLLITLKDRAEFTERLFHYLNLVQYPFAVIFADGSIGDENEQFFQNMSKHSAQFSYEYIRYPKDLTLSDYYKKTFSAISKVKTSYIMMADNDDFPIADGQIKAVEFLQKNPTYVGCNGRVSGLIIKPHASQPYGKKVLYVPYYSNTMDIPYLLDQEDPVARIKSYLTNFYSIYYSIFRAETLMYTFKEVKNLNFSELGIVELFISYMQLAQGKVHTINDITYIRQLGSSQAAASQKDWLHRLFYTNWLEDLKTALECTANYISTADKQDYNITYDQLYQDFIARHRLRFPHDKNSTIWHSPQILQEIILRKIFAVFPTLGEKLGTYALRTRTSANALSNVQNIIKKYT